MPSPKQPKLSLKKRRQRLEWVKVAAGTTVVLAAFVLVWHVSRLPDITVNDVEVTGTDLVQAETVQGILESKLNGSYLFVIPRANSLVFPKQDMLASLITAFPEIDRVAIVRDGWQKLAVAVIEREPVALWCTDGEGSMCYLMDKEGFIFSEAPADTALYVRFSGVVLGDPIGSRYLEGDFSSFKSFVEQVSSTAHRTPRSVLVEDNEDVSITFVQGGVLKFVRTDDPDITLDNIASVFASRRLDTNERLDYADFRFGNKVYVKFIEE